MYSLLDSKASSSKLAEWSPTDWPELFSEMRAIDNLLRCSICYEFFDVAMMIPDCSHNYCSLCIRRSLSYEMQCPTCSSKVNPPNLKSNRVLDELVKNFIKVRPKLLEKLKITPELVCGKTAFLAGDHVKDKANSSSNSKRRKASTRSSDCAKSFSPHNKRQKLTTNDNARAPSPGRDLITGNDEDEDLDCGSRPVSEFDFVTVKRKDKAQTQVEEEQSAEEKEVQMQQRTSPPVDIAECPVCGDMVEHSKINSHLDVCLTRTEKKEALRGKKKPRHVMSKSSASQKKGEPSLQPQDCPGSWEENTQASSVIKDAMPCPSVAASTSMPSVKGSNALFQPLQKRKALPRLVYSVMPDKEIRKRLKEWNLSTKGDRTTLVKRHQDFVLLYNAQCDSVHPLSAAQVAKEVEKTEKSKAKAALPTGESTSTALHFDKDQSEDDMDKVRQKYLSDNQHEFSKLIANVQRRRGKGKTLTTKNKCTKTAVTKNFMSLAKEISKILAAKLAERFEEILSCLKRIYLKLHPKQGEDDVPEGKSMVKKDEVSLCVGRKPNPCIDSGETTLELEENDIAECEGNPENSTNKSSTDIGGYPPFFQQKDESKGNSTKMFEASVVPEPPSSSDLEMLPEEEELTPSLGLDDKEWDSENDETSDPNDIPESPVIMVGKSRINNRDKQGVSSD